MGVKGGRNPKPADPQFPRRKESVAAQARAAALLADASSGQITVASPDRPGPVPGGPAASTVTYRCGDCNAVNDKGVKVCVGCGESFDWTGLDG
jgi:hypothetical protein